LSNLPRARLKKNALISNSDGKLKFHRKLLI